MEVGDLGTMAVVTDPGGATVFVWQPKKMPGFATRGEDGAPAWFELLTNDYDAVLPFYENVFGLGHPHHERHPGVPLLHVRHGPSVRSPGSWT